TTDHDLVEQATNTLGLFEGYGGTAIGDALALAVQQAQRAVGPTSSPSNGVTIAYHPRGPQSPVAILFLSDGHQTRGILQPLEGAARAKEAGIPVYTVALGTPNGVLRMDARFGAMPGSRFGQPFSQTIPVPPDPDTLRAIAKTTGGKFTEARNAKTLQAAYSSLGSRLGRKPGQTEITQWLVLIAAGLLLVSGLFAARWAPRLP